MATDGDQTTSADARSQAIGALVLAVLGVIAAVVLYATGHTELTGVAVLWAVLFLLYGVRGLQRSRGG